MPTVAYLRDSIIVLMFMKFDVGPIPKIWNLYLDSQFRNKPIYKLAYSQPTKATISFIN